MAKTNDTATEAQNRYFDQLAGDIQLQVCELQSLARAALSRLDELNLGQPEEVTDAELILRLIIDRSQLIFEQANRVGNYVTPLD